MEVDAEGNRVGVVAGNQGQGIGGLEVCLISMFFGGKEILELILGNRNLQICPENLTKFHRLFRIVC